MYGLYSDLFQALKGEHLSALGSLQRRPEARLYRGQVKNRTAVRGRWLTTVLWLECVCGCSVCVVGVCVVGVCVVGVCVWSVCVCVCVFVCVSV